MCLPGRETGRVARWRDLPGHDRGGGAGRACPGDAYPAMNTGAPRGRQPCPAVSPWPCGNGRPGGRCGLPGREAGQRRREGILHSLYPAAIGGAGRTALTRPREGCLWMETLTWR